MPVGCPSSELLLQGQHEYLKADELRAAVLDGAELRNFFELDVNELQARLNALPWVAQVSVRKEVAEQDQGLSHGTGCGGSLERQPLRQHQG